MVTWEVVMRYVELGWSLIPVKRGTKKPTRNWKPYHKAPATEGILRGWFGKPSGRGIAVILGNVSGGVVCRDFDNMAAYESWAAAFPDLARTLPTVATARGRHVYCRADVSQIASHSKSGNAHIIDFGDGELRGGGICVLPPSTHETGKRYRWIIPLDGNLMRLDLETSGLLQAWSPATESNGEDRREQRITETTEAIVGGGGDFPSLLAKGQQPLDECTGAGADGFQRRTEQAIFESLPSGPGRRNRQVFELARALKAIPELTDAPASDLMPYVRRWHQLALPVIGTKPFEETAIDFLLAWPKVRYPKGTDPMGSILAKAREGVFDVPEVAQEFQGGLRLLVSLCRELQRAAGSNPFYLSCRTAGRLLEVDHTTAWRWLFWLIQTQIVEVVSKGNQASQKANRYRYLPPV